MDFNIQDTYNKELPADPNKNNQRRQVFEACYSYVTPKIPSNPKLIHFSEEMQKTLGLSKNEINSTAFIDVFSGRKVLENTNPYSMCYGGHQFGHWAGQLGDGRAINLMEIIHENKRWALQLKGAGPTPYSRNADGLAVLRSSIREHLCSEAMYHLGVPTTRSLSLMLSGDEVLRDMMYDGNADYEKGAIVCRVAPSFIRFGNFQIFASRNDILNIKKLADYTIKYFYPEIKETTKSKYIEFFNAVLDRTLKMILEWQRVGFVHGVMNTDNLSILGLTIDYGPYGWLEGFDFNWTPNTTDRQHKRYRFGNQPNIALWNLYQLANALYPLVNEAAPFEESLEKYKSDYAEKYFVMMKNKLCLFSGNKIDSSLIELLEKNLIASETDMTLFFRNLSKINKSDQFDQVFNLIKSASYQPEEIKDEILINWEEWISIYLKRLNEEQLTDKEKLEKMNKINPKYVLRNYMAQLAIDAANDEDYSIIDELYQLLKNPYTEQIEKEKWFAKRPEWARNKVGCSMLSCSS